MHRQGADDPRAILDSDQISAHSNLIHKLSDSVSYISSDQYNSLKKYLCIAHFLSTWGTRAFEFAAAIVLVQMWSTSLVFITVYGLVDNLTTVLLGGFIGSLVDK